jgi:hypothetical protein
MGPNGGRGEWPDGRGWPRRSCIRTDRFRLDKNMLLNNQPALGADQDIFLADVKHDPKEMTHLANDPDFQHIVDDLSRRLDEHAREAVAVPHESLVRQKQ